METGILRKMALIWGDIDYVQKGHTMEGPQRYKYAAWEDVAPQVHAACVKHGVVRYVTAIEHVARHEGTTRNGNPVFTTVLRTTFRWCDVEDGSYIETQSLGEGADSGDKGCNKAMTASGKYDCFLSLLIATGDDPDHVASEEQAPSHRPAAAPTPQARPAAAAPVPQAVLPALPTPQLEPIPGEPQHRSFPGTSGQGTLAAMFTALEAGGFKGEGREGKITDWRPINNTQEFWKSRCGIAIGKSFTAYPPAALMDVVLEAQYLTTLAEINKIADPFKDE